MCLKIIIQCYIEDLSYWLQTERLEHIEFEAYLLMIDMSGLLLETQQRLLDFEQTEHLLEQADTTTQKE
jgi:hypothetical protein